MTNLFIQAIPLLVAVALTTIAFTGALKDDGAVVCHIRPNAKANTIVCRPRRDDGYGVHHACAPGMSDQICQDAIDANKRALHNPRQLP